MNQQAKITASEDLMANAVRALAMDAVQAANSGHPGAPMGLADVATVLFNRFMTVDPSDHNLARSGTVSCSPPAMGPCCFMRSTTCSVTTTWTSSRSKTSASSVHAPPAIRNTVTPRASRTTTGPLGQGISTAVGMAVGPSACTTRASAAISSIITPM